MLRLQERVESGVSKMQGILVNQSKIGLMILMYKCVRGD
jgi:hypothetical protein